MACRSSMPDRGFMQYPLDYGIVFQAAQSALMDCGFRIRGVAPGAIQASAGISLLSWGENLQVLITTVPGGTYVLMESTPVFLFDWGRGSEDIARFFQALDLRLRAGAFWTPAGPAFGPAPVYR